MDSSLLWFVRRMNDPEILQHIRDIVDEGFELWSPCDYVDRKKEYIDEIVNGSTMTFINSYTEMNNLSESSEVFIYRFIENKFNSLIRYHYNYWVQECDD